MYQYFHKLTIDSPGISDYNSPKTYFAYFYIASAKAATDMTIYTPTILLALLLLATNSLHSQNTPAQLAVKKEKETNASELLHKITQPIHDTDRIKLAIKACHVYWAERFANANKLDSCMRWAEFAHHLSIKSNYPEGSNEAVFMKLKISLDRKDIVLARKIAQPTYGELRVKLLMAIAEYYVYDFDITDKPSPQALPLILEAKAISEKIRSDRWWKECPVLLGKYYFNQNDIINGKNAFREATARYHEAADYATEAWYWWQLGQYLPENDSTVQDIRHALYRATEGYAKANDKKNFALSLRDLAFVNRVYSYYDIAEKQYQHVMQVFEAIGEKISPYTYIQLGMLYEATGQYNQALLYTFKALNNPDIDDAKKTLGHETLGLIYERLKDYTNSEKHYQQALAYLSPERKSVRFRYTRSIAWAMMSSGDANGALKYLSAYVKKHPPELVKDKQQLACTLGQFYEALKQYDKAEQYYIEMLRLHPLVHQEIENFRNFGVSRLTANAAFYTIGSFYTKRGRYKEGNMYLKKALQSHRFLDAGLEQDIHYLLFKSDSALGNYVAAINSLNLHRKIYDSINSIQRTRQINELNVQYESEQRKKDITLLENQKIIQRAALQREATIRNIVISGAIALLLLASFTYKAYRSKKKSNALLHAQRKEIDTQNQALQSLLVQKEQLLTDKEWLLKEVHHRVKNNLQIVMSLLSSQSLYLKSADAMEAILASENRIKSISLIHQKLYTGDNLSSIHLPEYVNDLLDNLMDAFDTRTQKIQFIQQVDDIYVDSEQAVPLGLILNEAVTNAIKHAFTAHGGKILVSLRQNSTAIALSISDNGKGLPADFDIHAANSQGMEMIQGLTAQLKGTFTISNVAGTFILITFPLLPGFTA